ncbi:MAG: hypothetical protein P8K79_05305 [Mariniblastus sp.]|nr:hypothetical protein [Mariniblastus sp.]
MIESPILVVYESWQLFETTAVHYSAYYNAGCWISRESKADAQGAASHCLRGLDENREMEKESS